MQRYMNASWQGKKSKASKKDWACEGEGAAAFSNAMASLEKHDQEDTR